MLSEEHLRAEDVLRKIVDSYSEERLGVFRKSLRNLFTSCAFEREVMASASRVVESDAFSSVFLCGHLAKRALPPR